MSVYVYTQFYFKLYIKQNLMLTVQEKHDITGQQEQRLRLQRTK